MAFLFVPFSPHAAEVFEPLLFFQQGSGIGLRGRAATNGLYRGLLHVYRSRLMRHSSLHKSFSVDGSGLPQKRLVRARPPHCVFLLGCRLQLIFLRLSEPLPFHPTEDPESSLRLGSVPA